MTRMEAEFKAYVMERQDRANHYFAKSNPDGSWRVDSVPVHAHKFQAA